MDSAANQDVSVADVVDALRSSLLENERLRKQNSTLLAAAGEPVAIVGMACRLPGGADTPEQLWDLLVDERDPMSALPADRGWDTTRVPAGSVGAFRDDAALFDAGLFGVSPREAVSMDPQQRVLLESSWEALERAGIAPTSLRGSRTGVFVGGAPQEYGALLMNSAEADDGYALTGLPGSVLSGRVAYVLGLEGPAVTVDTACSSSLVSLHLAVQSLRNDECDLALAGGVLVMTSPAIFTEFSRQGGLAGDGRCKSYADGADGTGWGEGVGVLVLERLSDARRNGHDVLAVVRGSAVNSDGASNGLTAPNGPSQQRVIRAALADAGLEPSDVDLIEGHGTGTALGDPIEAQALLATYGQDREVPAYLGSVKSNIGHTQFAAGVAGVIKAVLALRAGVIPASLHVGRPSSQVEWSAGAVEVVTERRAWPETGRVRRAGVSSFGISGTNAHVILEGVEETVVPAAADPAWPVPLVVSGRAADATRAQLGRLEDFLDAHPDVPRGDVAWTLVSARARLAHGAVLGADRSTTAESAAGGGLKWMFTGQGAQRPGMGARLYESFPAFAAAWDEIVAHWPEAVLAEWRLAGLARGLAKPGSVTGDVEQTGLAQLLLFAFEVSLARLLESWGVRPEAVVGHSIGELAAACVAGLWSVADACRVVVARAGLMQALPPGGVMWTVEAGEAEVADLLGDGVAVAAVNSATSTVLSGAEEPVSRAVEALRERGIRVRQLRVSHAFHSPLTNPMLDAFRSVVTSVEYREPTIPLVATGGGRTDVTNPDYWVAQVAGTVRFADAAGPAGTWLELGPAGVLTTLVDGGLAAVRGPATEAADVPEAVGRLWLRGHDVDWPAVLPGRRRVDLPTYAFQRERFWLSAPAPAGDGFWSLVERSDVDAIARELAVDAAELTGVVPALTRWWRGHGGRRPHEDWRYRVTWQPVGVDRETEPGSWLCLVPPGGSPVALPESFEVVESPADPTGLLARHRDATGVLSLLGGVPETLALIRAAMAVDGPPLWIATPGDGPSPELAQLWGLGQVAGLEWPGGWGGLIDLGADLDPRTLVAALASGEDQLALRGDRVLARRLVRAPAEPTEPWQPRGTVLVTGGTGGIGRHLARWLVDNGAERLVLLSRSGTVDGLADLPVSVVACDVSDRDALAAVIAEVRDDLRAVVHAAGVAGYRPLAELTADEFAEVVRGKVQGARWLDELTADLDLDAFVLFSSGAATWGGASQGAYAAGNAFLDALAVDRRKRGLPATSVAWGAWRDSGMADEESASLITRVGLRLMDPAAAIDALAEAVGSAEPTLTVADLDWPRFAANYTIARRRPLIESIPEAAVRPAGAGDAALRARLASLPEARRRPHLVQLVRAEAAAVLRHADPGQVAVGKPFQEQGFDSLTAVELRDRIAAHTGLALPASLLFDHPTVRDLAAELDTRLGGERAPTGLAPVARTEDDPIVIVGMACRLPGGIEQPADLWRLLTERRDAITPIPADRGWAHTGHGGFLTGAGRFDAGFFGVSPREAISMDPQQRVLLESSWEALERAGVDPASLRGSRTGVFVGGSVQEFATLLVSSGESDSGYGLTGASGSVLSGRVSYVLGLEGPAVTVDTACSSSLVSLHLAAQSLRSGECDLALAGGVTVMSTPGVFVEMSRQGGLAGDGRCKSYGEGADGTGWGEGVGVLVVERSSDARRNGHDVLAVVRGSAVNQDGASNGLTAPNGPAQQRVIRAALADAGLKPSDVDAVEGHGTGTSLGDPIEAQALLAAYGQEREVPLLLGSVKSNIGHTQAAAGVAGVIKTVLALRAGVVPASLHAEVPSTQVDWSAGAVEVVAGEREWPVSGRARRAGVSSFGISGTNAHVILEAPEGPDEPEVPAAAFPGPVPLVVSGRSSAAVRAQVERLADFLTAEPPPADVAWSLVSTRARLEHGAVVAPDGSFAVESLVEGGLGWMFTGQGAQRPGMGEQLRETYPVFARAWDEITAHFPDTAGEVDQTGVAQLLLFAFEVSLARLLQSWGIRPEVVIGHSIGELAAACVAGVWSIADACRVVAARASLMQALPSGGVMWTAGTGEAGVADLLGDGVSLAAVNGPASVVLSGGEEPVGRAVEVLRGRGVWVRRLRVSHAFHSPSMAPMLDEFRAVVESAEFHEPAIPLVATGGGRSDVTNPDYWVAQVTATVRFTVPDLGSWLEIGPAPVLTTMADGIPAAKGPQTEAADLMDAVGRLWLRGHDVDWAAVLPGRRRVALPTYAFQHDDYWLTPVEHAPGGDEFWSLVEQSDVDGLAGELALDAGDLTDVVPALHRWWRGRGERRRLDSWRYRVSWKPLGTGRGAALDGTWLCLVPAEGAPSVPGLADALAEHGSVEVVEWPGDPAVLRGRPDVTGVLSLLTDAPDTLTALQAAMAADGSPLWVVTAGAVAATPGEGLSLDQARLWGLGQVAGLEWPAGWGGLIDVGPGWDVAAFLGALNSGDDQLALRDGAVLTRRLLRASAPSARTWSPRGTVLVTGGTGGIGRHLARWLVENGAERLVLLSRSGTADGLADLPVSVVACDVADRAALAEVIAEIRDDLRAVVHAAGVASYRPLAELTAGELADVVRAKELGARWLDELTAGLDLDAFVLFSSGAATWGGASQGAYAVGNTFLDALAVDRRTRGLPATSLAWGGWDAGMSADVDVDALGRRGLRLMDPALALSAMRQAIADDETNLTVADLDWAKFAVNYAVARRRPLIEDIPEAALEAPAEAGAADGLRRELAPLTPARRRDRLTDLVLDAVAGVLRLGSAREVPLDKPFQSIGFDSLTAVELRGVLAGGTGLALPATLVFDHPTPVALADHLAAELFGRAESVAEPAVASAADPIAIVGMACRYPGGVASPGDLWDLVREGRDAVGPVPADRGWHEWPGADVAVGGFLADAAGFDAEFFGISPREALAMDPQQRLLLESAWEAFESAGVDPASLRGSRTGVFVGGSVQEYATLLVNSPEAASGYTATGASSSVMSGRISYVLGVEGPTVTVDTACSSSLVALHLAAKALRGGECDLAVAGGVTVMVTPGTFAEFGRQGAVAADGRCKAFGAGADGTGWAEGVGMLVVERLSDARRHGHEVLAVLTGSAINSDGASNGLTAPSGPAQQRVIGAALADAGLRPSEVDVVEAHGTGTALGDPIEAQAVLATYGQDRAEPVYLGSVKSNIGHSQHAAGVASVIKMVQALRHGELPATLHAQEPTAEVDWSAGAAELLTATRRWPETGRPRRAGVSGFGMSGTNAHVILEQAPEAGAVTATDGETVLGPLAFTLSGHTPAALAGQAAALAEHLGSAPDLAGLAHSLVTTRAALAHRAVVVAHDRHALETGLRALAGGQPRTGVVRGAKAGRSRVAFVFPGQGAQWAGMGRELWAGSPVFAESMDRCETALAPHVDWSLREVVDRGDWTEVDVVQPVSWAVMVSLAALWRAAGVEPDAVVGHSQGEIAAAVVAGALSLDEGARVVSLRSRLIGSHLSGRGGLASVSLGEADLGPRLNANLSIAAVNSPELCVVAGPPDELDQLLRACEADGVRARRIPVDYASHSAHVEVLAEPLAEQLAGLRPAAATVPFHSTLTGEPLDTTELDAAYWYRNLRSPVRFAAVTERLLADGFTVFAEMSSHPVLAMAVRESADAAGADVATIGTLRRDDGGLDRLLTSFAEAYVHGVPVDWAEVLPPGRRTPLPTYAFQHTRYWLPARPPGTGGDPRDDAFWSAVEDAGLAALLDIDADARLTDVVPALARWRQESRLGSWRYRLAWKPLDAEPGALTGRWLSVEPASGADDIRAALTGAGAEVVPFTVPADADPAWLRDELAAVGDLDGIVSSLALDGSPHPHHPELTTGLAGTARLLRALTEAGVTAPRWLLTTEVDVRADQAQVRAVAQIAGLEEPASWGGLVDLTPGWTGDALVAALTSGEDQLRLTPAGLLTRRLVRAPAGPVTRPWRPRGTVLITGGTGGIGGHLARWAAEQGASHVLLLSRRGAEAPGAGALRDELTASGIEVGFAACDVADRGALAAVLAGIPAEHPLTAVLHAAGVGDYREVRELDVAELAHAARGKVLGARHLDALTAGLELDAFVLFSSGAAVWGSAGNAAYAAANAALDTLAADRRERGLPAVSVSWGAWGSGGMLADHAEMGERLARLGVRPMDPGPALTVLRQAVEREETTLTVADIDWARFAPGYAMARRRPLIEDIPEARAALEGETEDEPASDLGEKLSGLTGFERAAAVLDLVRGEVAAVLGHGNADPVTDDRPFRELGFDSLTAMELRNRLTAATGLRLRATLVFDFPTLAELATHIETALAPEPVADQGELTDAADVARELDRIERALPLLAAADGGPIGDRLRELLAVVNRARGTTAADFDSTTDDELFDIIDRDLGVS
ncbi:type I polyketide synthase [Amycolatopsis sp. PS_44_ISF1]|uniref:type I polyketide synthase n=1 Tax=Amycolatopsis sp. PS_44_ISF1 TaxID=2974917 RepID=UPI0028E039B0|nr:SDR family NAD(P)-dependent oxidoreductase [Amycolatopsis sp. PS_44_ISF1]MDT8912321.1 SDR family NAD(P)-dependent oxidoreductase [Amycolatopsis sp. PS_44_ISF1]